MTTNSVIEQTIPTTRRVTTVQMPSLLALLAYGYLFALPFFGFSLLNVGGSGLLRIDWLFGGLLVLVFGLQSLSTQLKVPYSPANLWMFLYIATGILSGLSVLGAGTTAPFIDFTTKFLQLLIIAPTFFVISSLAVKRSLLHTLATLWVLLAFLIAAHALYQLIAQIFDLPLTSFYLNNPTIASAGRQNTRTLFGYTQPTSVFREPSYLGAFLGPPLILAGILTLSQQASHFFFRRRLLNWVMLLTLVLAVLLSGSQAILASLFGTIIVIYVSGLIPRIRIVTFALFTVVALGIVGLILNALDIQFFTAFFFRLRYLVLNILDPQNTVQVTSFADRYDGIQVGLSIWYTHPLLGVGLGNMSYHTDLRAWTNNPWLQLLVEQGVLGCLALVSVFFTLLIGLWQMLRTPGLDPLARSLVAAFFAVLVLTFINGFFTFNWTESIRIFTLGMANLVYVQTAATLKAARIEHLSTQQRSVA